MNNYQKLSVSVLSFIFLMLFMNICFELLEKKAIISSLICGTLAGVLIFYLNKKLKK